ncbi:MAG: hypothetical protein ABJ387_02545 [Balneola sp.]
MYLVSVFFVVSFGPHLSSPTSGEGLVDIVLNMIRNSPPYEGGVS